MPDIFLSYSRDDQTTARLFAEGFEREGFSVWWDATLNPGEAFDQVTEKALREAKAVVVLWSKKSVDSRWVRAEATQANESKTLVPVMIEACKRPIMFELTHTADLSQWTGERKDPVWQSFVAGVRLFVERGGAVPAGSPVASTSGASVSPVIRASRRNGGARNQTTLAVLIVALGVAILGMALLAVPAVRHLRETPPPETRVEINTPTTGRPGDFALSPDGRQIAFVASGDGASRLWVRSLGATTAQPLAGTDGATLPFWSPDSRSIGFFAGGALKRLDLGGGAPQTLAPAIAGAGGTWNAAGVILFTPFRANPVMRVSASGGTVSAVTTLDAQQLGHVAPFFLPDGRRFLFFQRGGPDGAGIYLSALDANAPTRLTPASGAGVLLPSGWLLYVRAGTQTLVAQRLDADKAALTGELVTVAEGVATDLGATSRSAVSVAASGLVAYRMQTGGQRQLTWFDRLGKAQGSIGDPDATLSNPRVSPDGGRVVVERTALGNTDLWLLDGTRTSRFTFDPANDIRPLWSPDGTHIVFSSNRSGVGDLYQKLATGAGSEERILASDQTKLPSSWSADGRFLIYYSVDPQTAGDLWVVLMPGARTPSVLLKTPFAEVLGALSPDGRWVAYQQANGSGGSDIYVRPFVSPGAADTAAGVAGSQWQVSTAGGTHPAWRPDGQELYYVDPAGAMMAAPIRVVGTAVEPGAPTMLFPTRIVGGRGGLVGRNYDVAPDGRFLINTELADGAPAPITLIQNWNPEAK